VIPHKGTSKQVIAAAVDVGIKQGKTVPPRLRVRAPSRARP